MKHYIAFSRRTSKKQREMLRKMRHEVGLYRLKLMKVKDLAELNNLEPDPDMINALAAAITQIEIAAYVDGRTTGIRKPRGRKGQTTVWHLPILQTWTNGWMSMLVLIGICRQSRLFRAWQKKRWIIARVQSAICWTT